MFEPLSNFNKYNNDNNLFISTNITYFPKILSCPDIPIKGFDESLAKSRVTSQEYGLLTTKMKQACRNYFLLTVLWTFRWISRFSLLYLLINILMYGSFQAYLNYLLILFGLKTGLFLMSCYVQELYRQRIQTLFNSENESTYKSRNLYWKVISGCRYIHLILNYDHFNCNDTIVTLDNSELNL